MPPTVLIIEDNDVTRMGLAAILHDAGYDVIAYADGGDALDYLRSGQKPALIMLDMFLPKIDGWRFLTILQGWPTLLQVPIIVATGTILTREWAMQHGCCGFLRKPFDTKELLAEVGRCISE